MKSSLRILLLFFVLSLHSSCSHAQKFSFVKSAEGILLKEGDKPRYFYQTATKTLEGKYPRANYIHPLYGLDGEVLTEDFPEDHFHHRGIFWTWHQLYVQGERIADPWFCEGIHWEMIQTNTSTDKEKAVLESTVHWLADSLDGKAVLEEKVAIIFERHSHHAFSLTFDITMTALVNGLEIGGSEDEKGYGGFSPRIKLPDDIAFRSEGQEIVPQNLPVQAGPWMELSGSFDGSSLSSVTIMGEPDKLPSYKGWILRSENSMQNMAFPGRTPMSLPKGKGFRFRNSLLVHKGLAPQSIEEYYQRFTHSN